MMSCGSYGLKCDSSSWILIMYLTFQILFLSDDLVCVQMCRVIHRCTNVHVMYVPVCSGISGCFRERHRSLWAGLHNGEIGKGKSRKQNLKKKLKKKPNNSVKHYSLSKKSYLIGQEIVATLGGVEERTVFIVVMAENFRRIAEGDLCIVTVQRDIDHGCTCK